MANPQVENGHLKIANEVWEHLMCSALTGSEYQVVMTVIRKTWGWNQKIAEISLDEFCKSTFQSERSIARALQSLTEKNILTRVKGGGRSRPSKWGFNKNWETWKTLPKMSEKINSDKINTVYNGSKTLTPVTEIITKNVRVSGCKSKKPKKQLSPKDTFKDNIAIQGFSTPAVRDEAYDFFAEKFKEKMGFTYINCKGDFVQLAALRKSLNVESKSKPPGWETACANYLDSPMGSYSIAFMVTGNRYPILVKSQLNQYGKPRTLFNNKSDVHSINQQTLKRIMEKHNAGK